MTDKDKEILVLTTRKIGRATDINLIDCILERARTVRKTGVVTETWLDTETIPGLEKLKNHLMMEIAVINKLLEQ